MLVEIGHYALALALAAALAQSIAPLIGAARGWADYMRVGDSAARAQFALIAASFAALTVAFLETDLSVRLVAQHSHVDKPLLYKISGVWGNHEGSMLLWVLILALYGALISVFGQRLPLGLKARTLAVQGMLGVAFIAFILFTSNPFIRLDPPAFEGADLNPVLQDPGLAFHPPFLYLGYVGLSTAFAFAVAALIEGRVDAAWARWVRPWTLAAWMFLTLGIALGSYWAYYELGWGGWWFWDPVENASFMPWLAAAALLHSAVVVEKRGELKAWTILLAIIAFSLSLIGTFIVRSGVITSVHAFASDPTRGVFILLILALSVGGALTLFAMRAEAVRSSGLFAPVSRESGLLLNNLILTVSTIAVFAGTAAPIVYQAFGKTISVGPPYFDWMFGILMVPALLALPIGAILPWKRGDLKTALWRLRAAAAAGLILVALVAALRPEGGALSAIGAGLAAWLVIGAMVDLAVRARLGRDAPEAQARRLLALPRAEWGKAAAHGGVGLMVFGIVMVSALESEDVALLGPGDSMAVSGYSFTLDEVRRVEGPNFVADRARLSVSADGGAIGEMAPERRHFTTQRQTTSEVAFTGGLGDDLYVALGEQRDDGRWAVRVYVRPYVSWIWIGALVMSLGGLLSLSDRRHRVGAPERRRDAAAPAAAEATPAE